MKRVSRRLVSLSFIGVLAGVLFFVFGDPLEPRLEGTRDSRAVFHELFAPGRGPANGVSVLDLMGPQRYVRGLLKLYDGYRPGTLPELHQRGIRWWLRHFFGKWPDIDQKLMSIRMTPDPTLEMVRSEVVRNLRYAGPAAAPAIDILVQRMESQGADADTIEALGAIGPAASRALPRIRSVVTVTGDPWLLTRMANALRQIEPGAQDIVAPSAMRGLSSTNERTRAKSADLLGSLGTSAIPAVPRLQELRNDSWSMVRSSAEQALESIRKAEVAPPDPRR